jgi:undecaprenyl-diphosphatase
MLSVFLDLDRVLFIFFNRVLANPVTDLVMPIITNGENWVIAVGLSVLLLIWKDGYRGAAFLAGIIVIFALCDQASAHYLKPVFERTRPCHVVTDAHLLIHCTHAYSFPSAHATNTFGCAVWLTYGYPQFRWIFFSLAALVSMSRVFVGVHYPFDIMGGWILGAMIALVVIGSVETSRRYLRTRRGRHDD